MFSNKRRQKTMSKKCPFNKFDPCIGEDCAFFLNPIKMKGFFDDTVVGENIIDPSALERFEKPVRFPILYFCQFFRKGSVKLTTKYT